MRNIVLVFLMGILLNLVIVNDAHAEVVPYQISFISPMQTSSTMDSIKGVRFNLVYGLNQDVSGLDFGFFNVAEGNQSGLQFGLFNSTFKSSGLQLGLINKTEYLNGLQIGILNIHNEGDLRFLPIVNFSF